MLVNQIKDIVNDAVNQALGKKGVTNLETTDFVSMGKLLSQYDAYEDFYGALANRIVKTVYFLRTYEGDTRKILRDEHEYGAFIQKVYFGPLDAVDDTAYSVSSGTNPRTYSQTSPYDVDTVVPVTALIYGGQGAWAIEIIRPLVQIKSAFLDESSMAAFIDGIFVYVENKFKHEEEVVVNTAVSTAIASAINGSKARNLLAEYNTAHPGATLTVATAMTSPEFLKFASKEINDTIGYMKKMSTLWNVAGYETFTDENNLVVEMLQSFASASSMYLQADTFHDELVKLPLYDEVAYWQSSGTSFAFADCSKIHITNEGLVTEDNVNGTVEQGGIICFIHDIENVAAYFGERRSWDMVNQKDDIAIHGEKARKGFAVDTHANGYVFYIAQ